MCIHYYIATIYVQNNNIPVAVVPTVIVVGATVIVVVGAGVVVVVGGCSDATVTVVVLGSTVE